MATAGGTSLDPNKSNNLVVAIDYKHFESKEVLFAEIVELTFAEAANLEKLQYDPLRPVREQLPNVTTQYIDHITTPEMIQLALMTIGELMRDHELAQKALSQINLQDDPVREFIGDAMADCGGTTQRSLRTC